MKYLLLALAAFVATSYADYPLPERPHSEYGVPKEYQHPTKIHVPTEVLPLAPPVERNYDYYIPQAPIAPAPRYGVPAVHDEVPQHPHEEYGIPHPEHVESPHEEYGVPAAPVVTHYDYYIPRHHVEPVVPTIHAEYGVPQAKYDAPHEEYGVPHVKHDVPHEEYGVPHVKHDVPHEEYGVPHVAPVETHYDYYIPSHVAPVIPKVHDEYGVPHVHHDAPHEEYGVPHVYHDAPHEEYGVPHQVHVAPVNTHYDYYIPHYVPKVHNEYGVPHVPTTKVLEKPVVVPHAVYGVPTH